MVLASCSVWGNDHEGGIRTIACGGTGCAWPARAPCGGTTMRGKFVQSLAAGLLVLAGATGAFAATELKAPIKEYDVPTRDAHPHDPALGNDGALWYTEQRADKIGRLDPATGQ